MIWFKRIFRFGDGGKTPLEKQKVFQGGFAVRQLKTVSCAGSDFNVLRSKGAALQGYIGKGEPLIRIRSDQGAPRIVAGAAAKKSFNRLYQRSPFGTAKNSHVTVNRRMRHIINRPIPYPVKEGDFLNGDSEQEHGVGHFQPAGGQSQTVDRQADQTG